jgi:DNA polymerase-3 subunit beta
MSKITMERKRLRDALALLGAVAPKKTHIPALSHIKLSANGDVTLAATDLEMGAVVRMPCADGSGALEALIPAERLAGYVRGAKGQTVTFEADGNEVTLDGCTKIVGIDLADFPTLPEAKGEPEAVLSAAELGEAISTVAFAVSREVTRYALTGILLELHGKRASVVASDGKRLAVQRLSPLSRKAKVRMILPEKAACTLAALCAWAGPKAQAEVRIPWIDNPEGKGREATHIHFLVGNAGMYTRLIEGHFPDWKGVIPDHKSEGWKFDRRALSEALASVRLATTEKTRAVRFRLSDGRCELYAKTQDVGDARAEVATEGNGEAEIVLNPDYVIDYLKALPKDATKVTMKAAGLGVGTTWHGPKGHAYVLMSLKDIVIKEPKTSAPAVNNETVNTNEEKP